MSNSANPAPTRPGFWWIRHVNPLAGKWRPVMVDTIHGVLGFKMFSWQGWMAVSEAEIAGMEWGPECVFPEAEESRTTDTQPKDMALPRPAPVEWPAPWSFELWQHLHREHGVTLVESELAEIVRKAWQLQVPAGTKLLAKLPVTVQGLQSLAAWANAYFGRGLRLSERPQGWVSIHEPEGGSQG